MSLTIKREAIDLGLTQLENLFILDFMPMANGTYVKVYLMAYYLAASSHGDYSNQELAKRLHLPLADVLAAWDFWQSKGIVKLTESEDKAEFDVEFLSIRELYIDSNYVQKVSLKNRHHSSELIAASLMDKQFAKLIKDIEMQYVKRPLTADEVHEIRDFHDSYGVDYDLIDLAFYTTFIEKKIKGDPFSYVKKIIVNWYDEGIKSRVELGKNKENYNQLQQQIKRIVQSLGIVYGTAATQVLATVQDWLEKDNYSEEYLRFVIGECAKRTNNLNINFVQYKLDQLVAEGSVSIEAARKFFDKDKASTRHSRAFKKTNRDKFNNTSRSDYAEMSAEDIRQLVKEKEKRMAAKLKAEMNRKSQ